MKPMPYVIGQWVRGERFYGRRDLIDEILDGPRSAMWLLGTRRVGKTSLLKQLELLCTTEPDRGYFPLFWDLQGSEDAGELHEGFADALLDAEERMADVGVDVADIEADDMFRSLGRLRRNLRKRGLRLLLLCDEVEELIKLHQKDPAILGKLRHSMQSSEDIRAVLASTIRLWALAEQRDDTSPFLHGFTPPLYIRALNEADARSLLLQEHLPSASRPQLDEADSRTLQERCDNHPYLLQLVGKRYLETGSLEETIERIVSDQMVSYFFSVDFDLLDPAEQELLRVLARDTAAASDSLETALSSDKARLQQSLQTLENLGFIRRNAERRFVLANYFFRRWLIDLAPETGSLSGQPLFAPTPLGTQTAVTTLDGPLPSALIEDRYELRRRVGEGATGVVYETHDRLLESRIALKLLRAEYAGNPIVLERFRQEILLSRNLGHPNILRVYHLGQYEGRAYLTMQWVGGPTLGQTIAEGAPLAEEHIAFIGTRLASALEAAHAHQVLHRDIKPQNILMDTAGEPLLTDFGLARLLEGPSVTTTGVFLGTPNYVSPEQASLETLDSRSDLYSLGVVLFEMATGRCPFRGETAGEILDMHRSQAPPDPRDLVADLSPELARIISSCLEKERDRRISSANQLRLELEKLLPAGRAPEHSAKVVTNIGPVDRVEPAGEGGQTTGPSAEDLLPLVYNELRRLARGFLSRERPGHTLMPTALVHEAYLRLAKQTQARWAGRSHFLAVGAKVMRRLLIDHARSRGRAKRGGDVQQVTFQEILTPGGGHDLGLDELLSLDAALEELAALNPRQEQIVELRFFAGLTVEEVADHLGVSKRTVEADWTEAREWLRERLARTGPAEPPL